MWGVPFSGWRDPTTQIYVATCDQKLHAYHLKGRRDFILKMPALVLQLEVLETRCGVSPKNNCHSPVRSGWSRSPKSAEAETMEPGVMVGVRLLKVGSRCTQR